MTTIVMNLNLAVNLIVFTRLLDTCSHRDIPKTIMSDPTSSIINSLMVLAELDQLMRGKMEIECLEDLEICWDAKKEEE